MIHTTAAEIRERALGLCERVHGLEMIEGRSVAGGGSTPEQSLATWLIVLPGNAVAIEKKLRANTPPIIARIENDRVVLDLRTVFADEEPELERALQDLSR
jgi:L-seryl-tRNA(Ser) seleniumtransferase